MTSTETATWLDTYETWERVAREIGDHDYSYDLADSSHRLDVVQIVLEAAARVAAGTETP